MKCEICHKADAKTAITRMKDGEEEELYVCEACAKAERQRRQRMSQRTRKITGLPPGMEMSVTEIRPMNPDAENDDAGGDEAGPVPPFLNAIVDAFHDMAGELEKACGKGRHGKDAKAEEKEYVDFPCDRVPADFRIRKMIHLEGLHLIGELEATKRALRALDIELVGVNADGVKDAGHVYSVKYGCTQKRVQRVIGDLLREEKNARVRLFEELPRIFGDSLCRALAILKNCRLLSPGEFFDILSPLGFAAREGMLDGVTYEEITAYMEGCDLRSREDGLTPDERDRVDAERADEMNGRFVNVMLNEKAEEKFL